MRKIERHPHLRRKAVVGYSHRLPSFVDRSEKTRRRMTRPDLSKVDTSPCRRRKRDDRDLRSAHHGCRFAQRRVRRLDRALDRVGKRYDVFSSFDRAIESSLELFDDIELTEYGCLRQRRYGGKVYSLDIGTGEQMKTPSDRTINRKSVGINASGGQICEPGRKRDLRRRARLSGRARQTRPHWKLHLKGLTVFVRANLHDNTIGLRTRMIDSDQKKRLVTLEIHTTCREDRQENNQHPSKPLQ